jgi:hypothetical protein
MVGWKKHAQLVRVMLVLFIYPSLPPSLAFAQVGHDPAHSPFRDITTAQGITVLGGRFAGARANAAVGARPGAFAAVRLETRLSGPLDLYATFGQAYSSRYQIFPGDTANRVRGPIDQTLNAADLAIVLNLTGAKRWHAFAPYTGVGFGILSASPGTTDPGGFRVGSNFIMAPTIGTRIFLGRALALRLEARDYWLRYEWPLAYYQPTDSTGGAVTPVLGDDVKTRQVTHNFTLAVGLSYLFTF